MKRIYSIFLFLAISLQVFAQQVNTPDEIYNELFIDVQMNQIFADGKTFVDCVPKRSPQLIMAEYRLKKGIPNFNLKSFIDSNFNVPVNPVNTYQSDTSKSVTHHIEQLWGLLQRKPDSYIEGSSLIPLPNSYLVPGGRFREIYYWDSYFTMLGLQESKETEMMENMVRNFAYLIDTYGHIPNGNRSYYVSRSQPPFFSLMVGLLAEEKGNSIYETYLPALEKEYAYWMQADEGNLKSASADRSVVRIGDFNMNRYWDSRQTARQESFGEDSLTALISGRDIKSMYHNLRAGAASGWDFSSR